MGKQRVCRDTRGHGACGKGEGLCPRFSAQGKGGVCAILVFFSFASPESEVTGEVQEVFVNPRGMIFSNDMQPDLQSLVSRLVLTSDVSYKPVPGSALFFQSNLLPFFWIDLSG